MTKLTDHEWTKLIREWCKQFDGGEYQRVGQAYVNALFEVRKDLHDEIIGTDDDCFYDDKKIINFIKKLNGDR